jgi:hypothetical protein
MTITDLYEGMMSNHTTPRPQPVLAVVVGLAFAAGFAIAGAELLVTVVAALAAATAWLALALLLRRS